MILTRSTLAALVLSTLPALAHAIAAGDPAPACNVKSLASGKPVDLAEPGKVTYVDFWASWCGPCAKSMPILDKMNTELKAKGFQVIGVNLDEEREDADEFLQAHPVKFTMVSNPDGECPSAFNVQAMPSSYLIDKHGKIRHVQLGFKTDEAQEIRGRIDALLQEP